MNSKENGTPSPLQMFKESTEKKNKDNKRKLVVQFLIIFILSHIARTLTTEEPVQEVYTEKKAIDKDKILLQLEVNSIIPLNQKSANLMSLKGQKEIAGVDVIESEINENGAFHVLLSIPKEEAGWVISNPNDWKLTPPRKISKLQRKSYEVNF